MLENGWLLPMVMVPVAVLLAIGPPLAEDMVMRAWSRSDPTDMGPRTRLALTVIGESALALALLFVVHQSLAAGQSIPPDRILIVPQLIAVLGVVHGLRRWLASRRGGARGAWVRRGFGTALISGYGGALVLSEAALHRAVSIDLTYLDRVADLDLTLLATIGVAATWAWWERYGPATDGVR